MESALAIWRASYHPTVGTCRADFTFYQQSLNKLGTEPITNGLLYDLNFVHWALSKDGYMLDSTVLFHYITKYFRHRPKCGVHSGSQFWLCWFDCARPDAGDIEFGIEEIVFRHENECVIKWRHWHSYFNSVIIDTTYDDCPVAG